MNACITPASLRRYSLFGGLDDHDLSRIAPRLVHQAFTTGQALINEGERGRTIYLVLSGRVEVTRLRSDGQPVRVAELGPGSTVGEMELLDLHPRSASVVALEPVEALMLDRAELLALSREHIAAFAIMVMNLARDLSRRLRLADAELARRDLG
jgi:CRP-like cAMP-binding protein